MVKLIRPTWYNEEFYSKERSPEEWLFELSKRYALEQQLHVISHLEIAEQEKCFIKNIFNEQIDKYLHLIESIESQPIRYPAISDIFLMYHQLINTNWYKQNPNREKFESAISAIINDTNLSPEQEMSFREMQKTPWCVTYEHHQQDNWCPKIEMERLSGIPLLLDPGYKKKDIIAILKRKFNGWVGKSKRRGIEEQLNIWQESQILAVFDLKLWFEIQKVKITNIGIHELIWPYGRVSEFTGEEVNPYDDIDHCIDLVSKIIDRNVICSLITWCEGRKFKKFST